MSTVEENFAIHQAMEAGKAEAAKIRADHGLNTPPTDLPTLIALDAQVRSWGGRR
jgi:hypothetical protein